MPIYEYEPTGHDCLICPNHFEVLQGMQEADLVFCPTCGLPCRRIATSAAIKINKSGDPEKAARKGLTTFKRAQKGVWEKVAGPGVDVIQGTPEYVAQSEAEKKPKKTYELGD